MEKEEIIEAIMRFDRDTIKNESHKYREEIYQRCKYECRFDVMIGFRY